MIRFLFYKNIFEIFVGICYFCVIFINIFFKIGNFEIIYILVF